MLSIGFAADRFPNQSPQGRKTTKMEDPNNPVTQLVNADEVMRKVDGVFVADTFTGDNMRKVINGADGVVIEGSHEVRTRIAVVDGARRGGLLLAAAFSAMGSAAQLAGESAEEFKRTMLRPIGTGNVYLAELSGTRAERRAAYKRRRNISGSKLARKAAKGRLGLGNPH